MKFEDEGRKEGRKGIIRELLIPTAERERMRYEGIALDSALLLRKRTIKVNYLRKEIALQLEKTEGVHGRVLFIEYFCFFAELAF